jgi:hypothetical protein
LAEAVESPGVVVVTKTIEHISRKVKCRCAVVCNDLGRANEASSGMTWGVTSSVWGREETSAVMAVAEWVDTRWISIRD